MKWNFLIELFTHIWQEIFIAKFVLMDITNAEKLKVFTQVL